MKRAICLQAGNGNAGDSVANLGCRGLFMKLFQNGVIYDSYHMAEPEALRYDLIQFYRNEFALVLCTPWIWDRCETSVKYEILKDFNKRATADRRLALGLGSAYHLDSDQIDKKTGVWDPRTIEMVQEYWEGYEHIVCRDRLAYHMFGQFIPEDRLTIMPCPSFYISQVFDIKPKKIKSEVLVYAEINSQIFWKIREDQVQKPMDYQDKLIKDGIDVITMIPRDRDHFRDTYGREPTYHVVDPLDIVNTIGEYSKLISPRVHACMPALSLGLDVEIIPLDTRALTAVHLGAKPIINSLELAEEFSAPIEPMSLEAVQELLRKRIGF